MRVRNVWSIVGILAITAVPILAHGWAPPPPPPPPPAGVGNQAFNGPAGTGSVGGGEEYNGPTGSGGTEAPAAPAAEERARATNLGPATGAPRGGSTTLARKPKTMAAPGQDLLRVAWVPSFLPTLANTGYGPRMGTVADALALPATEGGWARDQRPVMVLSYDLTNADHQRMLAAIDADSRVRVASSFFNCYRVDDGTDSKTGKARDAKLSVYTADGKLVGEVVGQRKLSSVYDLLETAWKKQNRVELSDRLPKMEQILKAKAAQEHFIPLYQAGIVCPDCGHERHDVCERVAELKARIEACDRAIEKLRTVAKN